MSHVASIKTEVRDAQAVAAACRRLQLPEPTFGTARLYNAVVTGLLVKLPDWRYPFACDIAKGELHYDNFNGSWGLQEHLDRFLQAYAVEKTCIQARRLGHTVAEQRLPDDSIKVTVRLGRRP